MTWTLMVWIAVLPPKYPGVLASVKIPGFKSQALCEAAGKEASFWSRDMVTPDANGRDGKFRSEPADAGTSRNQRRMGMPSGVTMRSPGAVE